MTFSTIRFTCCAAVMAACWLPFASVHALDKNAAACEAAMLGDFKIVEKRTARGSSKSDDGDRIKISRDGKSYAFSFVGPDGKAFPDDTGKPNVEALVPIDPEALWKMLTGNDKEAIDEAKKSGSVVCGLKGKDGYFMRMSDKTQTSFTATLGSGFGSVVLTLEKDQ